MQNQEIDFLKLENQICFPLYALSRSFTAIYQPLLEKLKLTYPQYLVMMVLWEHKKLSVKEIGNKLMLDSGTLTPLLKRIEEKKLLQRTRSAEDERVVFATLTEQGIALRELALDIPAALKCALDMSIDELITLKDALNNLLKTTQLNNNKNN